MKHVEEPFKIASQIFAPGPGVTAPRSERQNILADAEAAICGPRERDYGHPADNFERIAAGWAAIFGAPVSAAQVALAMDWVKSARLIATPNHRDSWVDKAGYSALGGEVSK